MQDLQFPIDFIFNISTFSNDFEAKDASGKTKAYIKQKMFKFKEEVLVYNDTSKTQVNYKINADKWLDFSAAYNFTDKDNKKIGKVVRKGWKSIWKAEYQIIDENDKLQYTITEDNPWVKVFDSLLGEVPVLSFFTGYLFNPTYSVKDIDKKVIVKLKKMPSFFGRKFQLTKEGEMDSNDDDRIMLSLMMMLLLERRRG